MKRLTAAITAALLLTAGLLDSRYNIELSPYSLYFENLPAEFDGYKIALVTDLHGKTFGKDNSRLIKKLHDAEPDLIAIVGDMVSAESHMETVEALLKGIEGLAPIYYVNGNHEWGAALTGRMEELMESYGATCLSNEFMPIDSGGSRIIICGAEDKNGHADMPTPYALADKLKEQYPEDFVLWLYHRNDTLIYNPRLKADLVLSGHAHGGIVRLPLVGGVLDVRGKLGAEYENGLYTRGELQMLVSRGLGNSVIIPRFLNRPELPVITLRSGSET